MRIARVAADCIEEAELALSEACTQVCQHLAEGKGLEVLINVGAVELTMHVLESGNGFQGHDQGTFLAEVSGQNSSRMMLMNEFADRASFSSNGGGGSIRLTKQLRRDETPQPSG
jgi:hypothetical protein